MARRQYFSGDEVLAMLDPDVEDGGLDDTFAPGREIYVTVNQQFVTSL